ncbi:MAG: UDP-N-acetylmuramate dehydrogenase [Fibrobacteres bacterium]|nr:UDP-N-acetylmuramate dehydrogenase [Fibrobacterota bacterium]
MDVSNILKEKVVLANYCTYKIGGPADYYAEPSTVNEIKALLSFAEEKKLQLLVLGRGSNVLISDKGYRGLVINLSNTFNKISFDGNRVCSDAGADLEALLKLSSEQGLGGAEALNDIPGTVGGAVFMNAGAFDSAISDFLVSVTSISRNGTFVTRKKEEISFGYRFSDYKNNGEIILSANLEFVKGDKKEINSKLTAIKQKRDEKQPPDRDRSCGSVFKRPPGNYAGTLIEKCGLKGFQIGGAKISEKHANFIINTGNATAADVKNVIEAVQNRVFESNSIRLETEVIFVGE